jgi:hypothetical protein
MIDALREYAADRIDRLHVAPNRELVARPTVELSSDAELADWLAAGQLAARP